MPSTHSRSHCVAQPTQLLLCVSPDGMFLCFDFWSLQDTSNSWREKCGSLVNAISSQTISPATLSRWTWTTTGQHRVKVRGQRSQFPCPANWSKERLVTPKCHMGSEPWVDWYNVPVTTSWESHFHPLSFLIRPVYEANILILTTNIPDNSTRIVTCIYYKSSLRFLPAQRVYNMLLR